MLQVLISIYHQRMKVKRQHENATKALITQRLRTDLERSAEVTSAIQLVWLNRFMGFQPSHLPQKLCNDNDTNLKISK